MIDNKAMQIQIYILCKLNLVYNLSVFNCSDDIHYNLHNSTDDCLAGEYNGLTENMSCAEIGITHSELCAKRFVRQRCCVVCANHTSSTSTTSTSTTSTTSSTTVVTSTVHSFTSLPTSPNKTVTSSVHVDVQCQLKYGPTSFMCRVSRTLDYVKQ